MASQKRNWRWLLLLLGLISTGCLAQTKWDDTTSKKWPAGVTEVQILSSQDGTQQHALFYAPIGTEPRPLIVSLHTWSGDYLQSDPLVAQAIANNYGYVHPNFRGPNTQPKAAGSPLVISDINDAIGYALKNARIDPSNIHIIGASGGGYATLLCYTRLPRPVKSYSAWVPIADVESWYYETQSRKLPYSNHIWTVTGSKDNLNALEARARSPLFDPITFSLTGKGTLQIYTGVHDGYTGSVPVTQSIRFYNKLIQHFAPQATDKQVSSQEQIELLAQRQIKGANLGFLGSRKVHLHRSYKNIALTVFEGTHEQLTDVALGMLPIGKRVVQSYAGSILSIGASNEYAANSWVHKLQAELPHALVTNYSIPGNTVGFDNLNNPTLNTLHNLDSLITLATNKNYRGTYDYILIALGTNDCKAIFKGQNQAVLDNYRQLIRHLKASRLFDPARTTIVAITPPPMDHTKTIDKYEGGDDCIRQWNETLRAFSQQEKLVFLDTYSRLKPTIQSLTIDGVHLTDAAQASVAALVNEQILRTNSTKK